MEDLIPWLYLKGVSTGDFGEALESPIGPSAKGFSPNVIVRLKQLTLVIQGRIFTAEVLQNAA